MAEIAELSENPTELDLVNHLAEGIPGETNTGEETGQAEAAPETKPTYAEAAASTDDKGQAEDASPKGEQAEAAPEGEEQTEQSAEAKQYTPEEIAAAFKAQESYKEAQAAMTRATQEAADLRKRIEAIEAASRKPQTDEEYLAEALNDDAFKKHLVEKGYGPEHFADEDGNLGKNLAVFVREREAFQAEQRTAEYQRQEALAERQTIALSTFDTLTGEYEGDKDGLKGKVINFLNENYGPALYTLPVKGGEGVVTMKSVIEGAIRAVEPKLFERADHATEAARIEKVRQAAAMSTAQPKGKPGGPADLTPLQKQGEEHMASLEEVLHGEHFIPKTLT